jgi:formamidopyrimidine-DNA glycosylase
MPEAPELEVAREFFTPRLVGTKIVSAVERKPLVLRNMTGAPFAGDIAGREVASIRRRGKLLLFGLSGDRVMVVSPMLTGTIRYCEPGDRMEASAILMFDLEDGHQLRYLDQKRMGQVYYLAADRLDEITRLENQGPDVLDEPLSLEEFREGLRKFRGEIKGILTRGQLVSGIGNAYADEVLFDAQLFPFRKVGTLKPEEVERLHSAAYGVVRHAVDKVRELAGDDVHKKRRSFLKVHGKSGEPCPRCGYSVSAITANKRETNFCRKCQPGSMFKN